MNDNSKCLIFIINWQQCEDTQHLLNHAKFNRNRFDIFIFDNEASVSSQDFFKKNTGLYTYYQDSIENLGFAAPCNIGLNFAEKHGYEFIFFLNNDVIINNSDAEIVLNAMQRFPKIALASPVIKDSITHDVTFCGATIDISRTLITHVSLSELNTNVNEHRYLLFGTAFLGRVKYIREVEGFCEPLFAYWEDFLLCQQLIKCGYHCAIIKEANVLHQNDRSQENMTFRSKYYYYYLTRNEIFFWKKTTRSYIRPIYWLFRHSLKNCFILYRSSRSEQTIAIIWGFLDGCLGRLGRWQQHPKKSTKKGI